MIIDLIDVILDWLIVKLKDSLMDEYGLKN